MSKGEHYESVAIGDHEITIIHRSGGVMLETVLNELMDRVIDLERGRIKQSQKFVRLIGECDECGDWRVRVGCSCGRVYCVPCLDSCEKDGCQYCFGAE